MKKIVIFVIAQLSAACAMCVDLVTEWDYFPVEGFTREELREMGSSRSGIHVLGRALLCFDENPLYQSCLKVDGEVYRMLVTGSFARDRSVRVVVFSDGKGLAIFKEMKSVKNVLGEYEEKVVFLSSEVTSLFKRNAQELEFSGSSKNLPGMDGVHVAVERLIEGEFSYLSYWKESILDSDEVARIFEFGFD